MRPRQHERRRAHWTNADFVEQLGCDLVEQLNEGVVVFGDLVIEMCDALRESAHRQLRALPADGPRSRTPEPGACGDELSRGQVAQVAAEFVGGSDHESFEFVDRCCASANRSSPGNVVHPQGFTMTVV